MTTVPSKARLDEIAEEHRLGVSWRDLAKKYKMAEDTLRGYYFPETTIQDSAPPLFYRDPLLARLKRGLR